MDLFGSRGVVGLAPSNFAELVQLLVDIIYTIIPVLFGLALVGFLFGVTRYGFSHDSEESKKSARQIMIWGIVILFVMSSIWGILNILSNTFL